MVIFHSHVHVYQWLETNETLAIAHFGAGNWRHSSRSSEMVGCFGAGFWGQHGDLQNSSIFIAAKPLFACGHAWQRGRPRKVGGCAMVKWWTSSRPQNPWDSIHSLTKLCVVHVLMLKPNTLFGSTTTVHIRKKRNPYFVGKTTTGSTNTSYTSWDPTASSTHINPHILRTFRPNLHGHQDHSQQHGSGQLNLHSLTAVSYALRYALREGRDSDVACCWLLLGGSGMFRSYGTIPGWMEFLVSARNSKGLENGV